MKEWAQKRADEYPAEHKVQVGDYYEDCGYHPLLCIESDYVKDTLTGISLVNGNIRSCSCYSCGVKKLTKEQAIQWRLAGPPKDEYCNPETFENKWWDDGTKRYFKK